MTIDAADICLRCYEIMLKLSPTSLSTGMQRLNLGSSVLMHHMYSVYIVGLSPRGVGA